MFAKMSQPHWNALLRFAMSLCYKQELAEDLLQTSLVRGVKYFEGFANRHLLVDDPNDVADALADPKNAKHFKNWLYKIVRNVYFDERKANSRLRIDDDAEQIERMSDSSTFDTPLDLAATSPDLVSEDVNAAQAEFFSLAADDELAKQIAELSDRQRAVVYLAAEEYSYKEIAALLKIPMGTVMSTLSRSLQKLRRRPNDSTAP